MKVDLIEVKPKNNKIKIVAIIIVAIIFVVFFSILGIYCAKGYNDKIIANKREKLNNNNLSNQIAQTNQIKESINMSENINNIENREHIKKTLLPVYSDNSKKEMKNIYNKNSKVAFLTFDDGPSQAVTPLILDLLKEENIKATFFVLGSNVKKNPDIVKRAYLEGHYIANHGYSHNYSNLYKNAKNVLNEYYKAEKEIRKAIGNNEYSSHLFRFPGGYYGGKYAKIKKEAGKILNENDISYIDWNVLTGDAEGANTKEKILRNIKKYTKNKGNIVVLMHDASAKILTYETLKDVIDYLRGEGYTFENFYYIMQ